MAPLYPLYLWGGSLFVLFAGYLYHLFIFGLWVAGMAID